MLTSCPSLLGSECGEHYTKVDRCIGLTDAPAREASTATGSETEGPKSKKGKKEAGEVEDWLNISGEILPSV